MGTLKDAVEESMFVLAAVKKFSKLNDVFDNSLRALKAVYYKVFGGCIADSAFEKNLNKLLDLYSGWFFEFL